MKLFAAICSAGAIVGVAFCVVNTLPDPSRDAYSQFFKHGDSVAVICSNATFAGQYGYSNSEVLAILDTNGYVVLVNKNKITAVALVAGPQTKEEQVSEH